MCKRLSILIIISKLGQKFKVNLFMVLENDFPKVLEKKMESGLFLVEIEPQQSTMELGSKRSAIIHSIL